MCTDYLLVLGGSQNVCSVLVLCIGILAVDAIDADEVDEFEHIDEIVADEFIEEVLLSDNSV